MSFSGPMSFFGPIGREVAHLVGAGADHSEIQNILQDAGALGAAEGSLRSMFNIDGSDEELYELTPQFKLGYTKFGDPVDLNGRFVSGQVSVAEKYSKELQGFVPAINVHCSLNHKAILDQGAGYDDDVEDEISLKIAARSLGDRTLYPSLRFDTVEDAEAYFQIVDRIFNEMLTEQGADGHILTDNGLVQSDQASQQGYNDLLSRSIKLASLDHTLKAFDQDASALGFVRSFIELIDLPHYKAEVKDGDKVVAVHYIFDNDVGEYCFYDNEDGEPSFAHWTYPADTHIGPKSHYEGAVDSQSMHAHFLVWLADAAKERGLISEQDNHIVQAGESLTSIQAFRAETPSRKVESAPSAESNDSDGKGPGPGLIIPSAGDVAALGDLRNVDPASLKLR